MPLIHGYSRRSISANIRAMMHEGRPQDQAVAIALKTAREAFETRHPKRRLPANLAAPTNPHPAPKLVTKLVKQAAARPRASVAEAVPCGCQTGAESAKRGTKEGGILVERAVFEVAGHRVDRLPRGKGVIVHPDHRWFANLTAAKKWLRAHTADAGRHG